MNTKSARLYSRFTQLLGQLSISARARVHAPVCAYTRVRVGGAVAGFLLLATLLFPTVATAATQGYNTQDKTIAKGMAVAISATQGAGNTVYVEKSSIAHADKTLGVVVDPSTDTVAVSSAGGDQVYVATTGSASVFVTELNGAIHKGDLLAPSPLAGVLMLASDGTKGVVGSAETDFPTTGVQSVKIEVNGGGDSAKVATLRINMDVKFVTNSPNSGKTLLQRLGEAIVHHEVSTTQALVALIIIALLIVVEGGIVYAAVNSSITSLGRNPLARNTIMKGLGQVTVLVAIVFGLGLGAVYLVLWV